MNSRERARLILNHQEADRPAIDLGSTIMTGTSAWTYRALKRALGLPADTVRVVDIFQMLAEVEEPVLDALGVDFAMLPRKDLLLGLTYGTWKPYTFWDGQRFEAPADFAPRIAPDGALEIPDERGGPINMRLPVGGRFFDRIPDTVGDIFAVEHIPEAEWSFEDSLSDEFLREEQERARALYESTSRALVCWPPVGLPQGYGGTYYWAVKMLQEPEYCGAYMLREGEAVARAMGQYMEAVGPYVDVVLISGADYGAQQRELFRPELFRDFFVPSWKPVTEVIHRYPHAKTWIHCCGSVPNLLPYFVEAGVDCLNPVQWTAAGMDLRALKAQYGDQLVFWGGATSTQRTFPFGTAEEVAREAQEVLEIMAPGGGFVVNPIHNIQPDVPVENILALYRTAMAYRY